MLPANEWQPSQMVHAVSGSFVVNWLTCLFICHCGHQVSFHFIVDRVRAAEGALKVCAARVEFYFCRKLAHLFTENDFRSPHGRRLGSRISRSGGGTGGSTPSAENIVDLLKDFLRPLLKAVIFDFVDKMFQSWLLPLNVRFYFSIRGTMFSDLILLNFNSTGCDGSELVHKF